MTNPISRAWRATARFRAGLQAGIKSGVLVGETIRTMAAPTPVPQRPDTGLTHSTATQRTTDLPERVNRLGTERLREYAQYETNRRAEQSHDSVQRPGREQRNPPATDRTRAAVDKARGRSSPGKSRSRGR